MDGCGTIIAPPTNCPPCNRLIQGGASATMNMEAEFLSLGLDIIGLGVFNYDFGSITAESPVIKVRE